MRATKRRSLSVLCNRSTGRDAVTRTGSHRIAQDRTTKLFDRVLQIDYWRNGLVELRPQLFAAAGDRRCRRLDRPTLPSRGPFMTTSCRYTVSRFPVELHTAAEIDQTTPTLLAKTNPLGVAGPHLVVR